MVPTGHTFQAYIEIIGANPYVHVPDRILQAVFQDAGRDKGPIPIRGKIGEKAFRQTIVRYSGAWRLYINASMLKDSPRKIGEKVELTIAFDPEDRTIAPHPQLVKALRENQEAAAVFDRLPPSRRQEIVRYISSLKTEASVDRNGSRAIDFLLGKGRFVGRDRP
ncbi:YdeI/OmpD-associated family protein [Sabulibacter ruber]|uniref:YdeI/OmpD-associated family protein n=1 Tax=Sabulibacter ruber TaxID=2811901 RepID=UPI001A9619F6|nr:YdeI/OmpD-associated family protein [Sabulibacter ruber]